MSHSQMTNTINCADEIFTEISYRNNNNNSRRVHVSVRACVCVSENVKNKTKHGTGCCYCCCGCCCYCCDCCCYCCIELLIIFFYIFLLVHLADYSIHFVDRAHRKCITISLWMQLAIPSLHYYFFFFCALVRHSHKSTNELNDLIIIIYT